LAAARLDGQKRIFKNPLCVGRQMLKISAGKTKSYGEIAAAIGNPKAVPRGGRRVRRRIRCPVLVSVPSRSGREQKLGGFSGGLDWKRSLLKREGIKF